MLFPFLPTVFPFQMSSWGSLVFSEGKKTRTLEPRLAETRQDRNQCSLCCAALHIHILCLMVCNCITCCTLSFSLCTRVCVCVCVCCEVNCSVLMLCENVISPWVLWRAQWLLNCTSDFLTNKSPSLIQISAPFSHTGASQLTRKY